MAALAILYDVAFGSAAQTEFLCCEYLSQAVEKHHKDGHGHDNHVVADATGEKEHVTGRQNTQEEKHKTPLTFLNVQVILDNSGIRCAKLLSS